MKRRRALTPREKRMWERVAKTVRQTENRHPEPPSAPETNPLPEDNVSREIHPVPSPYKRSRAEREDLEKLLSEHPKPDPKHNNSKGQTKERKRSGEPADRGNERKVRRGKIETGPVLDLHGHTQDSAKSALFRFVSFHRSTGESSVLVITGKGRAGGGIIRTRFIDWISESEFRLHVSGYSRAHQRHGGDGAFYLFLRKKA